MIVLVGVAALTVLLLAETGLRQPILSTRVPPANLSCQA